MAELRARMSPHARTMVAAAIAGAVALVGFGAIAAAVSLGLNFSAALAAQRLLDPGPVGGVALLAAKRFYFGVGGGTRRFMAAAAPAAGLRCEVLAVVEDGRSNVREVLRVERG